MPLPRLPLHVGIALGASCAAYAGSLVAVTALESSRREVAALEVQPLADAGGRTRAANDRLDATLAAAAARYDAAAAQYQLLTEAADRSGASLAALADELRPLRRALRTVRVPSLPARSAVGSVSLSAPAAVPPAAHATTGGSGKP
jgi:multidrug resistance efflux pump